MCIPARCNETYSNSTFSRRYDARDVYPLFSGRRQYFVSTGKRSGIGGGRAVRIPTGAKFVKLLQLQVHKALLFNHSQEFTDSGPFPELCVGLPVKIVVSQFVSDVR